MSSFLGHSLAAAGILAGRRGARDDLSRFGFLWFGCLLLAAIAPDLDYFVPALAKSRHGGIRISHSMGFAFIVPAVVCMGLVICGVRSSALRLRVAQIVIAGQSHIFLDFLVGVHPMPLFWPLVDQTFRSPIGFLPSAGSLQLTNIYLYRNLALELGIYLPVIGLTMLCVHGRPLTKKRRVLASGFVILALVCVAVASSLSR